MTTTKNVKTSPAISINPGFILRLFYLEFGIQNEGRVLFYAYFYINRG